MLTSRYLASIDHIQQAAAIIGPRDPELAAARLLLAQAVEMLEKRMEEIDRQPAWAEDDADEIIMRLDVNRDPEAHSEGDSG